MTALTPVVSSRSWLERVRRDARVPHSAFRLAHAVATQSTDGKFSAPLKIVATIAGLSVVSTSQGIDRLAALGHMIVHRQGPGEPIELKLSRRTSQ